MESMMMVVILLGLAIVVSVVAYGSFGRTIFSLFSPDKDAVALNSFGALTSRAQTMLDNDAKELTMRVPLQLPKKNYCIVAFDTDFVNGNIAKGMGEAFKPTECHQQACFCLYYNPKWGKPANMENGLIKCFTFDYKDVVFYSENVLGNEETAMKNRIAGTDKSFKFKIANKNDYLNFVIFGKGNHGNYDAFGTQDMWLEKRIIDNKNYIYIALWNSDNIKERMS